MLQETPQISNLMGYSASCADLYKYHEHQKANAIFQNPFNPQGCNQSQPNLGMHIKYQQPTRQPETTMTCTKHDADESTRRIVRVFIVDPDEDVPVDKAVLYSGDEQFTELTDQELFFEVDIKDKLVHHNTMRQTILDKDLSQNGKDVYLDAIRIRDLKMVVVTIASF